MVISDRQLRPRRHLGTQSEISQRGDDEKNPRETKSRSVRSFRIESDLIFLQDGHELLADLVRHMHPYCIRTDLEKESRSAEVHVSAEEEEEFVDVEGYEEQEENFLGQSGQGLDLNPKAESGSSLMSISEEDKDEPYAQNISSLDKNVKMTPQRSALVKTSDAGRMKKTVTFAVNLVSVHEIPPDDESDSDLPDDSESTSSKNDITSPQKPKSLSLQQYRLLRQKKQPPEERRMDFRTKWPSLPDLPRELPPILPDLFKFAPKLNLNTNSGVKVKAPAVKVKISASQPEEITRPSGHAVRTSADLCIDPPNPVLVPLKPTHKTESSAVPSSAINSTQTQPAITDSPELLNSDSKPDVCVSCEEVRLTEVVPVVIKPETSAPGSPARAGAEPLDQRSRPSVLMPTTVTEKHSGGQQDQTTCGEIGEQIV